MSLPCATIESLSLKIVADPKLHAGLHALRKQVTLAGNIRFDGHTEDSHCDRFMAKALRQEAFRPREELPWKRQSFIFTAMVPATILVSRDNSAP